MHEAARRTVQLTTQIARNRIFGMKGGVFGMKWGNGERRKEKGERRKEKGERRMEKGERRKENGELSRQSSPFSFLHSPFSWMSGLAVNRKGCDYRNYFPHSNVWSYFVYDSPSFDLPISESLPEIWPSVVSCMRSIRLSSPQ